MTVTPLTFTQGVVEGHALLIAAETDPTLAIAFTPTGKYTIAQTGIYTGGSFPLDVTGTPNIGTAVLITPYPISDDPTFGDSEIGLQIKSRSAGPDIRGAWEIDDGIADVLLGRWSFTLPNGIAVTLLTRSSSTGLGKDDSDRQLWVSNYTAAVHRPSAHRL